MGVLRCTGWRLVLECAAEKCFIALWWSNYFLIDCDVKLTNVIHFRYIIFTVRLGFLTKSSPDLGHDCTVLLIIFQKWDLYRICAKLLTCYQL